MTTVSVSAPVASGEVTLPARLPELTLGWEVAKWAGKYLRHANGPRGGLPFRFTDSQMLFLLHFYALTGEGRWVYDRGVRRWPKGAGKAEVVSAVLPTPSGWTTVEKIQPGDELFGADGSVITCLQVHPVLRDTPTYEVTLSDGTSSRFSGGHLFDVDVFTGGHKRVRKTLSVEEMLDEGLVYDRTLTSGSTKATKGGVARYVVPAAAPLDLPDADLPLDPYVFGMWLGDGDSDGPRATIGNDDAPFLLAQFDRRGIEHGELTPTNTAYRVRFGGKAGRGGNTRSGPCGQAKRALRDMGVLGDKHVPMAYLRAGTRQRMELLQGLMDSDGSVTRTGSAEFSVTNRRLADDVAALIRTLGMKVRVRESDASINGRVVGKRYRLAFTSYSDLPAFTLPRKVERLRQRTYSSVPRTIASIERVKSEPMRCITVSAPDSLYLTGETLWVTHNSPFAAVHALAEFLGPVRLSRWDGEAPGGCVGKRQPLAHVQIAATTLDQTANTMKQVRAMTPKGSRVVRDYGLDTGMLRHNGPDGSVLEVITSSAAAAEGAEVTFCVADETEWWTPSRGGLDLMDVIERNLSKSSSRLVETCNAWQPGQDSVAQATWEMYRAQQDGRTRGEARVLYDARIPAGVELADKGDLSAGLAFAYGDTAADAGGWVDLRTQANFILNGKTKADVARRFYLNQPTASVDAWTTPHQWSALADATRVVVDGEAVALFFDGSLSNDATALVGCCVSDGHVFTLGVWEPNPADEDDRVSVVEVDNAVAAAFDRYTVLGFFADVREWESFTKITWPGRHGDDLAVWAVPGGKEPQPIAWDMRGQTDAFTKAAELCLDEIEGARFTHDGDQRVARHVANARRRPNRSGVSVGKETRDSPRKIDAAVCVIGARMVRRQVLASKEYVSRSRRGGLTVW